MALPVVRRSVVTMTTPSAAAPGAQWRVASAGVWLLPVHALLLALTTLTHEPDHSTRFGDWSRFVTTDMFVVSHLLGSILGAGLGLVGLVAALLFLVRGPAATAAMVGVALTVVGTTLFTAMFGAAAFAQPAIGRSFLDGGNGMRAFYDDVYGAPLFLTFGVGALLFLAGAVVFGTAVARTSADLRWPGYAYAASLVLYLVTGFTISFLQPVAGVAAAVASVLIARRLPRTRSSPRGGLPQQRVPTVGG